MAQELAPVCVAPTQVGIQECPGHDREHADKRCLRQAEQVGEDPGDQERGEGESKQPDQLTPPRDWHLTRSFLSSSGQSWVRGSVVPLPPDLRSCHEVYFSKRRDILPPPKA